MRDHYLESICQPPLGEWPAATTIATGHQPVIYHMGLLYKNYSLQSKIAETGAKGVNVVIDTDNGEGGVFAFPEKRDGRLVISRESLGDRRGIYLSQRVMASDAVKALKHRVLDGLSAVGRDDRAEWTERFFDYYIEREGEDLVESNSTIRRKFEGEVDYEEIRFSELIARPEAYEFFGELFADYERFVDVYNRNLTDFRSSHKIKNKANPFPDLQVLEGRYELPFWVLNLKEAHREPLWLETRGNEVVVYAGTELVLRISSGELEQLCSLMPADYLLVPRALVTSLVNRKLVCDLMIHGVGGGKYDQCTDEFVKRYFGRDPAMFVVASGTASLFPDRLEEAASMLSLVEEKRQIYFNVEKYFEQGIFLADEISQLEGLIASRKATVEQIKLSKQQGESTADLTKGIKEVDSAVKKTVDCALERKIGMSEDELKALHALYAFREFPFFMFG